MSTKHIMPASFFDAGGEFTGQINNMRYLIIKEDDRYKVSVWKGPYRYDTVNDDLLTVEYFEPSENVIDQIKSKLEKIYSERESEWESG